MGCILRLELSKPCKEGLRTRGPKWPRSGVGAQNTILNPYWLWAPGSPEMVESDLNSPVARPLFRAHYYPPCIQTSPCASYCSVGLCLEGRGRGAVANLPFWNPSRPHTHVLWGPCFRDYRRSIYFKHDVARNMQSLHIRVLFLYNYYLRILEII